MTGNFPLLALGWSGRVNQFQRRPGRSLFVPGYQENLTSRNYGSLIEVFQKKGFKAKFVSINWKRTVIDDWVEELNREYIKHDAKTTILSGFSFGAMTALATAANRNPSELWVFSLSPYFKEELAKAKKSWLDHIGKRRTAAFQQMSLAKTTKLVRCRTLLFLGDLEAQKYPSLLSTAKAANKLLSHSKLITVSACGHDVTHPKYLESIGASI